MMVGLELRIRVRPNKRLEFVQMGEMFRMRPALEGCIEQKIYEEVDDSSCFLWSERWVGREKLDRYMKSEDFRVLLGAIDVLGELTEKQVVEISKGVSQS